jgi:hypothetical protein
MEKIGSGINITEKKKKQCQLKLNTILPLPPEYPKSNRKEKNKLAHQKRTPQNMTQQIEMFNFQQCCGSGIRCFFCPPDLRSGSKMGKKSEYGMNNVNIPDLFSRA